MKLFKIKRKLQTSTSYFLGIPFFKEKHDKDIKKRYFFGICIKKQQITAGKNELFDKLIKHENNLNENMFFANSVAFFHRAAFADYQNRFRGKNVWLFACGPSLKNFTAEIPDGDLSVGLNKAFKFFDKSGLDYIFVQDKNVGEQTLNEIQAYQQKHKTQIFAGIVDKYEISQSFADKTNARRYYTDFCQTHDYRHSRLHYDICNYPLGDFHSVAFSAMQFILWTNPAKIYLVGCDCTTNGYFNGNGTNFLPDDIVDEWRKLKEFALRYYPETKIISINPVGLKGLFDDLYTPLEKD